MTILKCDYFLVKILGLPGFRIFIFRVEYIEPIWMTCTLFLTTCLSNFLQTCVFCPHVMCFDEDQWAQIPINKKEDMFPFDGWVPYNMYWITVVSINYWDGCVNDEIKLVNFSTPIHINWVHTNWYTIYWVKWSQTNEWTKKRKTHIYLSRKI